MSTQIVVGATRPRFRPTIIDPITGSVVPLSGGTVRLQGTSEDIAKKIDVAGTIYDGPNGVADWGSLGTLIAESDLGSEPDATYTLKVKYTDASSLVDWTEEVTWDFIRKPDV